MGKIQEQCAVQKTFVHHFHNTLIAFIAAGLPPLLDVNSAASKPTYSPFSCAAALTSIKNMQLILLLKQQSVLYQHVQHVNQHMPACNCGIGQS